LLELKNIKRSYQVGEFKQIALNDVSLQFPESEFVSILGTSGSGKTTLLNIIGGLDQYDSGDLVINGTSTKNFKSSHWDYYRNNSVGFVFQNYQLISHISVLSNVEMGMTLSGVSVKVRKKKALEVLDKVGLKEHAYKKPNQLSGGQMQRVAIARALANDPDIILADEPTGALDSSTSVQVMELIKEISKDKLVIMVTHNKELAEEYSDRIIQLKDGKVVDDSSAYVKGEERNRFSFKKTSMSFFTAFRLSLHNIFTKKGRTLLTAFASSIGIIGISLILALSNGFDIQIDNFEKDTLSSFPIMISKNAMSMDEEEIQQYRSEALDTSKANSNIMYSYDSEKETIMHANKISEEYLTYLDRLDKNLIYGISYFRSTHMNLIYRSDHDYHLVDTNKVSLLSVPDKLDGKKSYLEQGYDLLEGVFPSGKEDLVLEVDANNRIEKSILEVLGISDEEVKLVDVIGRELKLVLNDDYYQKNGEFFTIHTNLKNLYESEDSITLKIVGVVRAKEDNKISDANSMLGSTGVGGLYYQNSLLDYVIDKNKMSSIVKSQIKYDYNVLNGETLGDEAKEQMLVYLGGKDIPYMIYIYPSNFEAKASVLRYLDKYNDKKKDDEKIIYNDMAATMISLSSNIMNAITIVLVAFSAISLVVSGIMIAIITYISVLERTREIGILRALGARGKDISRVFNAETFIIGLTSGFMGVGIARLLLIPVNVVLKSLTELDNVAKMSIYHALLMICISVFITFIGGVIPAKIASRKNPVEALRSE